MERNRPRIKPRIHEWMMPYSFIRLKIRGWSLGEMMFMNSKVNTLRAWWSSRTSVFLVHIETQSATGEELRLSPSGVASVHFG